MKHILRLLIVLGLCVGTFFVVSLFIKDKAGYDVYADLTVVSTKIEDVDTKLDNLTTLGLPTNDKVSKLNELNNVYKFYNRCFNDALSKVKLIDLSSNNESDLKSLKKKAVSALNELSEDIDKVVNYLNEPEYNAGQLDSRINGANNSLINAQKKLNDLCLNMQNIIASKIHNGSAYVLTETLNTNILYIAKVYYSFETNKGYNELLGGVLTKYSSFIENPKTTNNGLTYMVAFYELSQTEIISGLENYFNTSNVNAGYFAQVLAFLQGGSYNA